MEVTPNTIKITAYTKEDVDDFCNIISDYSLRLSEVEHDFDRIKYKLRECGEFIDNITVPFAFEYTKISFKQSFDEYWRGLETLWDNMNEFPHIAEVECLIALNMNTYEQKKKCINYLDMLLSYYNVALKHLEQDIDECIKRGLESYGKSKACLRHCK